MVTSRVALLLLLLPLVLSWKIEDTLKNVGKRYLGHFDHDFITEVTSVDFTYKHMTVDQANTTKYNNALNLVNHFMEASSSENQYYTESLEWIHSIIDSNMEADNCDKGKKYNPYQYIKFWSESARKIKKNAADIQLMYTVLDTPKEELKVNMMFEQTDQDGATVTMHYDVSMKATYVRGFNDSIFSITHISQGGACLNHADLRYGSSKPTENIFEYMRDHPGAQNFLSFFTPRVFEHSEDSKFSDHNVNHLPTGWLVGLSNEPRITVGKEVYTPEQFHSWYHRFGQMWHPKEGDLKPISTENVAMIDSAECTKCLMVANITMNLQIGTDKEAPVHSWVFKVVAEIPPGDVRWRITHLGVNTPSTVTNLMDINYLAYRDVVGSVFNLYVNDRKQWHTATDFAKHFKKRGDTVELYSCGEQILEREEMPKTFQIHFRLYNASMIGYLLIDDLSPLPAAEDTSFSIRTKMRPPSFIPQKGGLFGSDWTFSIKWDKMDQFYYIYKADFSCPKFMKSVAGTYQYFRPRETADAPRKKKEDVMSRLFGNK